MFVPVAVKFINPRETTYQPSKAPRDEAPTGTLLDIPPSPWVQRPISSPPPAPPDDDDPPAPDALAGDRNCFDLCLVFSTICSRTTPTERREGKEGREVEKRTKGGGWKERKGRGEDWDKSGGIFPCSTCETCISEQQAFPSCQWHKWKFVQRKQLLDADTDL